ncbi:MAG: glycosyltransferase family 1 protein [Acholeplasmataceae bacterium]|jgi:glycosyltransferase involved in cell wall biosynthesis|nr:glycosyltransferase family 1 protein [Acholeplasmataceae bacterium]
MKIGVDAFSIEGNRTGVGNYTYFNILYMVRNNPSVDFYLFSKDNLHEFENYPNVHNIKSSFRSKKLRGTIWLLYIAFLLNRYNFDIFWSPNFFTPMWIPKKTRVISTVMDLSPLAFPNFTNKKTKNSFNVNLPRTLKRSDTIIAISDFTKSEIIKYYPKTNADKIRVNYVGYDDNNVSDTLIENNSIRKKYNIEKKFILSLSSLVPRKNTITLVKAFNEVLKKDNDYNLVLVGRKDIDTGELSRFIFDNNISDRVIFTDFIPDSEILWFYKNCDIYVSTSLYEGFGIPNIEAYISVKRMLISDIPVYREIFEELVEYFNPLDVIELSNKILNTPDLIKKSDFLIKFNWESIASKTFEILIGSKENEKFN